jgi:predicted AlkP superfamily phosphohydrolase/phosphomutase
VNARLLVIGLDSATWRLMRPWLEAGRLPQISRLVQEGASGVLESVIPPLTGPAWTSFLTGKNPGRHGLFSFMKRRPGTYEMAPTSTLDIHGQTLADILSRHGKRIALVNVPMTYPPRPLHGIVVTGLDTPGSTSAFTYPPELQAELKRRFDYEVEPIATAHEGNEGAFLQRVRQAEAKRAAAARYLLELGEWDLFAVVFRGTDLLSHYFWRAQDPSHPGYDPAFAARYGNVLRDHYEEMDSVIGELVGAAGDGCTVVVMSDHGSGPIRRHVYLDNWLLRQGLMQIKRTTNARLRFLLLERGLTISNVLTLLKRIGLWRWVRRFVPRDTRLKITGRVFGSAAVDWPRTLAYPVGIVGAININLRGREPQGAVSPGDEYEQVMHQIQEALLELRDPDSGEPLVAEVLRKEEVYEGPYLDQAPDLLIRWQKDEYKATFILGASNQIMSPLLRTYSGFHTMDGMVAIQGPGIKAGVTIEQAGIADIAPTLLALLGLPIPDDMDGCVLTAILAQELDLQYEPAKPLAWAADTGPLSAEEEQWVTDRLKGLGYL